MQQRKTLKFIMIKIIGSITLVGGFMFAPESAMARCGCEWIEPMHHHTRSVIRSENQQVREEVKTSIEQQTSDLRTHLDAKTIQLIRTIQRQAALTNAHAKAQNEAHQRIIDAAQVNDMNRLRDEFRAKAESGDYDPNPHSCLLLDQIRGSGSGRNNGSAVIANVENHISGNSEIVQEGGVDYARYVAEKREEFAGYKGSPHATSDWNILLGEETLDFSDPQMAEISSIIIRNGLDSTPQRAVNPQERLTQRGLSRIAANEERKSRLSAASQSIAMAMNMRSAVLEGPGVDAYKTMAADSTYDKPVGDKLSELQQIDIMTTWNYSPAGERLEVLANSGGMNEKAWLYELHRVISINARLNYLNLELANRDAIVNANILAALNDNT